MLTINKSEWLLLAGLLLLSFVPSVGGIFRLIELLISSDVLPENPRIRSVPLPAVFHIMSSALYCILGAFQFLPSIRKKYPTWHRIGGRLLVSAGIMSATSGLWMTHYYSFPGYLQGNLLYVVRVFVAVSMAAFIILGVFSVLKMQIVQHQAWMIRAYALGQGAGTQVLIIIPWLVTIGEPSRVARELLMTAAWMVNIVVAEWVINKQIKRNRTASVRSSLSYHT